jgi:hypothetical protein
MGGGGGGFGGTRMVKSNSQDGVGWGGMGGVREGANGDHNPLLTERENKMRAATMVPGGARQQQGGDDANDGIGWDVFGGKQPDKRTRGITWWARDKEKKTPEDMGLDAAFKRNKNNKEWEGKMENPLREKANTMAGGSAADELMHDMKQSGGWNRNFTVTSMGEWNAEFNNPISNADAQANGRDKAMSYAANPPPRPTSATNMVSDKKRQGASGSKKEAHARDRSGSSWFSGARDRTKTMSPKAARQKKPAREGRAMSLWG